VTQDDPAVPLRHKCSPSRPSSALCGPPAGRWGSIPGRSTAGSGSCTATAPEILAQAPGPTCRCPRLNGRRCAFSPRRDRRPGRGHSCPLPGAGVRRRLRRPADRGAGRAPPKPGRSAGLAVTVHADPKLSGASECRLPRQPACRGCPSTTFATPPWRCGSPPARRPRRSPSAGHTSVSFTLDRYGHQTIPRPVAEGQCHRVRD
jgi:hypothetical protein